MRTEKTRLAKRPRLYRALKPGRMLVEEADSDLGAGVCVISLNAGDPERGCGPQAGQGWVEHFKVKASVLQIPEAGRQMPEFVVGDRF